MIPLITKLIATASLSAIAVAGAVAPVSAATSRDSASSGKPLPTPTSQAKADGVKPGNAQMNWQRAESTASPASSAPLARMSATATPAHLLGIDMASYAGSPSAATWKSYASKYKFVFIKSTEGTYYNPGSAGAEFNSQYAGATAAGIMRGAYHFANPHDSGGAAQADYFVNHGGGWSPDGKTLPGVLDIEYNPYKNGLNTCWGLTKSQMVSWIRSFSNEYLARTGVYPTIYSTVGWWTECTGDTSAFANTNPFWIADPNSTSGPGLPSGTAAWTYWQYGQDGQLDSDQFNGSTTQLTKIAKTYAYNVGTHVASAWKSSMGHPIGPETAVTAFGVTGYYQRFPKGYAIVTSKYGTYLINGAILSSWSPATDGWPTSTMRTVTASGYTGYAQNFALTNGAKGRAVWSKLSSSTVWMSGAVLNRYDRLGGIAKIGWPRSQMTTQTTFGVTGWVQRLQGGKALIASKYGTYFTGGAIFRTWRPAQDGWPTTDLKAATLKGRAVWLQRFRKGTAGVDYASNPQGTTQATWVSGTP